MDNRVRKIKEWLQGLSFRAGVLSLAFCAVCYGLSFAQMLLPLSVTAKGVLWTVFFGLAKTLQYSAVIILGKVGIARVRAMFRKSEETGS